MGRGHDTRTKPCGCVIHHEYYECCDEYIMSEEKRWTEYCDACKLKQAKEELVAQQKKIAELEEGSQIM